MKRTYQDFQTGPVYPTFQPQPSNPMHIILPVFTQPKAVSTLAITQAAATPPSLAPISNDVVPAPKKVRKQYAVKVTTAVLEQMTKLRELPVSFHLTPAWQS